MNEKPILFSGEMVRAILAGRKTQTRRVIKPQPSSVEYWRHGERSDSRNGLPTMIDSGGHGWATCGPFKCPYIPPGMYASFGGELRPQVSGGPTIPAILWVRETFLNNALEGYEPVYFYRADDKEKPDDRHWNPSIFMPRKASRISLEITSIRVERLKDISNEDCFAEGLPADTTKGNRTWYGDLWEEINGKGSWDENPWVWVVAFKQVFNTKPSEPEL